MARILIADDDAHTVRVMSIWLKRNGHEVVETRNGAQALEKLKETRVDLVLSDMNMPVLNGTGLLRGIREELKLEVPFIMLTSRCDQDELIQQVKPLHGELFPKPFVPSRLVMRIEEILGVETGTTG